MANVWFNRGHELWPPGRKLCLWSSFLLAVQLSWDFATLQKMLGCAAAIINSYWCQCDYIRATLKPIAAHPATRRYTLCVQDTQMDVISGFHTLGIRINWYTSSCTNVNWSNISKSEHHIVYCSWQCVSIMVQHWWSFLKSSDQSWSGYKFLSSNFATKNWGLYFLKESWIIQKLITSLLLFLGFSFFGSRYRYWFLTVFWKVFLYLFCVYLLIFILSLPCLQTFSLTPAILVIFHRSQALIYFLLIFFTA